MSIKEEGLTVSPDHPLTFVEYCEEYFDDISQDEDEAFTLASFVSAYRQLMYFNNAKMLLDLMQYHNAVYWQILEFREAVEYVMHEGLNKSDFSFSREQKVCMVYHVMDEYPKEKKWVGYQKCIELIGIPSERQVQRYITEANKLHKNSLCPVCQMDIEHDVIKQMYDALDKATGTPIRMG